ncbi:MAG: dehypoxanthine futalosine cyclase, partial [Planctomycetaceae bacterium]|nr:dehypoxanthine futalosine cyclase [Planctomycetaceae bacterium]
MEKITDILDKAVQGGRLSQQEAVSLLEKADLPMLGEAADLVTRRRHPEPFRTYNVERNINYTNVCSSGCQFCAFYKPPEGSPEKHYVMSEETLLDKIRETVELGGNQILLQGGLHPDLELSWYENFLRTAKRRYPEVNIHGFSPTEIVYFSKKSGRNIREVLERLRAAGLGSLPGGGAEILSDRVRTIVSPRKASAGEWLDVCRTWHQMGGKGSATMMFGHLETLPERVEHLARLRELQDETGGFTAFICWTFQPGNTRLSHLEKLSSGDYLRMLAVSRLFLDNFANLQASWVTQGMEVAARSLHFGANDMGSLMIEENVVAA